MANNAKVQEWLNQFWSTGQVVVNGSRGKLIFALIACVVFAVAGIAMIFADQLGWGLAALVFFGLLGVPAIGYQVMNPSRVVVDRQGVSLTHAKRAFTAVWPGIYSIGLWQQRGASMVQLFVDPRMEDAYRQSLTGIMRQAQKANQALAGGDPVIFLPANLEAGAEELSQFLHIVLQQQRGQQHQGWQQPPNQPPSHY